MKLGEKCSNLVRKNSMNLYKKEGSYNMFGK